MNWRLIVTFDSPLVHLNITFGSYEGGGCVAALTATLVNGARASLPMDAAPSGVGCDVMRAAPSRIVLQNRQPRRC
jgi:hypothetical protein